MQAEQFLATKKQTGAQEETAGGELGHVQGQPGHQLGFELTAAPGGKVHCGGQARAEPGVLLIGHQDGTTLNIGVRVQPEGLVLDSKSASDAGAPIDLPPTLHVNGMGPFDGLQGTRPCIGVSRFDLVGELHDVAFGLYGLGDPFVGGGLHSGMADLLAGGDPRAVVKVLQVLSDPVHRLDDGRGHVGRTVMLRVIRDLLPLADVARIRDIIGGQRIVHLAQHAVRVGGKRVGRFQGTDLVHDGCWTQAGVPCNTLECLVIVAQEHEVRVACRDILGRHLHG